MLNKQKFTQFIISFKPLYSKITLASVILLNMGVIYRASIKG